MGADRQSERIAARERSSAAYEGADLEALHVLRRYRNWIVDEFRPYLVGNAVEIGAGIGSYSECLLDSVGSLELVEPSIAQFRQLTGAFSGHERVRVVRCDAEEWARGSSAQSRDTVVMINVLEHIADDTRVLGELCRVLRPGGHLLLFVPALEGLYSRLDKLLGHHRRYHLNDLVAKVADAGFRIVQCRYFDVLGVIPWFIVNRLGGATGFNASAAQIYDAVGVPLTRAIERHWRPPFGKNLILVARRP